MSLSGPVTVDLNSYLAPERVVFLPSGCAKIHALDTLCNAVVQAPNIDDPQAFHVAIHQREEVSSTGIGGGIAVPHAKLPSISGFAIGIGLCPEGIEFGARDGQPVDIMVMIAASDGERENYLRVLASVATLLKQPERRATLRTATTPAVALGALQR